MNQADLRDGKSQNFDCCHLKLWIQSFLKADATLVCERAESHFPLGYSKLCFTICNPKSLSNVAGHRIAGGQEMQRRIWPIQKESGEAVNLNKKGNF